MRAVLTRVKSASVAIDGNVVGKIGQGFLILLGVGPEDTAADCRYLAEKALSLRIFEDENGKMNLGLADVGGQVLVVSQFTLYGNCRKGRRPSLPKRRRRPWAISSMSSFWRIAPPWAIRRSTVSLGRICRWRLSMTGL